MDQKAFQHLFVREYQQLRHSIPQYVIRTENETRYDKYERYYDTVRKEAFLHLCPHQYYQAMHEPVRQWIRLQLSGISFNHCIDLGCGVGHWSGWLASNFKDVYVTGIDLSYQLLRVAQNYWVEGKSEFFDIQENGFMPLEAKGMQCSNLNFVQADMLDLPLKPNAAELVLSLFSIDRVRNIEQVIRSVQRILKPGGHFLIISPFNFQFPEQWNNLHPIERFLSIFEKPCWKLKCHNHSIPYFVPLDIRNNKVVYQCEGFLFKKKPG